MLYFASRFLIIWSAFCSVPRKRGQFFLCVIMKKNKFSNIRGMSPFFFVHVIQNLMNMKKCGKLLAKMNNSCCLVPLSDTTKKIDKKILIFHI